MLVWGHGFQRSALVELSDSFDVFQMNYEAFVSGDRLSCR